ncbi:MAG: hypothetical protein HZA78_08875 [Candidatus Schekmanbacteria bacterium]|nr:hypothetical protein [Candidatus Schekmanbacteria bacterium]
MSKKSAQYIVDEQGGKIGVIISIEEYQRLKQKSKIISKKGKVQFGSGHLGKIQGELSREDIYCDR